MSTIRIASCNLEWMNDWFTTGAELAAFKASFQRDGQTNDTRKTARRVAAMMKAMDADIVGVQEAPSRPEELRLFIDEFLSDNGTPRYKFFMGDSGGSQKLALLYKPGSVTSAHMAPSTEIAGLIEPWLADVDGDASLAEYQFTRVPLVVNLKLGTHRLQVLVAHTKSNFVNNGAAMWKDPARRLDYVRAALKARRRNGTEGMRLRAYLDSRLAADTRARILVMGDLNDGPGLDYFERNYLAHNVTDIILGSAFQKEWMFDHAQHDVPGKHRYTAVFNDFVENARGKKLLLDHVLLSPGLLTDHALRKVPGSGAIHHAEFDAQIVSGGKKRENRPSDHRPASVQLTY